MTNEEAKSCIGTIEMLQRLAYNIHGVMDVVDADNCKKIIKALEQQPCDDWHDVPSDEMTLNQARQAVKDLRKKLAEYLEQQPCEDCISREQAIRITEQGQIQGYEWQFKKLCALPSVTPKGVTITDFADRCRECGKQKVGKWIDTGIGREEFYGEMFVCSECNSMSYYENYCPNCGAKMAESEGKE